LYGLLGLLQQSIHVSQVYKGKVVVAAAIESSGPHKGGGDGGILWITQGGGEAVAFRRQNQVRQLRTLADRTICVSVSISSLPGQIGSKQCFRNLFHVHLSAALNWARDEHVLQGSGDPVRSPLHF